MRFLLLGLLFCTFSANAQQLSFTTAPSEGVSLHWGWAKAADLQPGSAGSYVSWDFSGWQDSVPGGRLWADPSGKPFDSVFFKGNLQYEAPENSYNFLRVNSSGAWLLRTANNQAHTYFLDSMRWMRYPMVYGDSLLDNFKGLTFGGAGDTLWGRVKMYADGFGQLKIPGRTIDSVMRLHYIIDRKDSFLVPVGFPVIVETRTEIFRWMKDGSPEILAEIGTERKVSGATGSSSRQWGFYGRAIYYSGTGRREPGDNVLIYPQPAKGNFYLQGITGETRLRIFDLSGRELWQGAAAPGSAVSPLLPTGYYVLEVQHTQGISRLPFLWQP